MKTKSKLQTINETIERVLQTKKNYYKMNDFIDNPFNHSKKHLSYEGRLVMDTMLSRGFNYVKYNDYFNDKKENGNKKVFTLLNPFIIERIEKIEKIKDNLKNN